MVKTNKEFRSDLAKQMRDKRKERDAQLEQIEKSSFSEWLKEQMRKEIKENFDREINEMKNRSWYEESRKTHLNEVKSKSNVKKAKAEKQRLQEEYEEKLAKADADIIESEKQYEDAKIQHWMEIKSEDTEVGENTIEISREELEIISNLIHILFQINNRYNQELGWDVQVYDAQILDFKDMNKEELNKCLWDREISSYLDFQLYVLSLCRKYCEDYIKFKNKRPVIWYLSDFEMAKNYLGQFKEYLLDQEELKDKYSVLEEFISKSYEALYDYCNYKPINPFE